MARSAREVMVMTFAAKPVRGLALPVGQCVDDAVFAEWVQHFDGVPSQDAFGVRREQLGGLMNYRVPAVRLERDIDMGALACH